MNRNNVPLFTLPRPGLVLEPDTVDVGHVDTEPLQRMGPEILDRVRSRIEAENGSRMGPHPPI
jgi:hypothetical protein